MPPMWTTAPCWRRANPKRANTRPCSSSAKARSACPAPSSSPSPRREPLRTDPFIFASEKVRPPILFIVSKSFSRFGQLAHQTNLPKGRPPERVPVPATTCDQQPRRWKSHFANGSRRFANGSSRFTNGSSHFTNGSSHFTKGATNGSSHFANGSSHFSGVKVTL